MKKSAVKNAPKAAKTVLSKDAAQHIQGGAYKLRGNTGS